MIEPAYLKSLETRARLWSLGWWLAIAATGVCIYLGAAQRAHQQDVADQKQLQVEQAKLAAQLEKAWSELQATSSAVIALGEYMRNRIEMRMPPSPPRKN